VFKLGLHVPVGGMLMSCLICSFFIGWPMAFVLFVIVVFAIFVVAQMIP